MVERGREPPPADNNGTPPKDAAYVANQHVDNCGLPQFIKDEMRQFIQDWMKENMQNVPLECQQGCNGAYE